MPIFGDNFTPRASNIYAIRQAIKENTISGSNVYYKVNARDAIADVAATMTGRLGEIIKIFSLAMADDFTHDRDRRVNRLHNEVGKLAHTAVLNRYNSIQSTTPHNQYDRSDITGKNKRYARGALGRALSSDFYRASWDGVAIINSAKLDREAKQWARLNFGAGAIAGSGSRSYTLSPTNSLFGSAGVSLSLNFGPSPGFWIPGGRWERGGTFLPGSFFKPGGVSSKGWRYQKRRPTAGIRGRNFLDAGVSSMAKNLPSAWEILVREWFFEAAEKDTGPVRQYVNNQDAKTFNVILKDVTRQNTALARRITNVRF